MSTRTTKTHSRVDVMLRAFLPLAKAVKQYPADKVYSSASDTAHRARITGKYTYTGLNTTTGKGTSRLTKIEDRWDVDASNLPDAVRAFLACDLSLTTADADALRVNDPTKYAAWNAAKQQVSQYRAALRQAATKEHGIPDARELFATFANDAKALFATLKASPKAKAAPRAPRAKAAKVA